MLQDGGFGSLFSLAASSSLKLPSLMDLVLEQAIELTAGDQGAALCIAEPGQGHSELKLHPVQGSPKSGKSDLLEQCKRTFLAWNGSSRLDPQAPDLGESGVSFFRDGRSMLSERLFEGEFLTGILQVESSRDKAFSPAQRKQLSLLARCAETVLARILMRDNALERGFDVHMVGRSPAIRDMERKIRLIATDPTRPVLIMGERGSGKELTAFAIHYFSRRRNQTFLPVNSAAFSDTLLSDELFGHDKHSFTGAQTSREGAFKAAEGGTLFFDEIGDMPAPVQASLLRVLDRGELHRIGRDQPVKVDVRIVAATNRDLRKMIAEGAFRADLFDRLNVFPLEVPPLRDRKEDIPLLVGHFLRRSCAESHRNASHGSSETCRICRQMETAACASPGLLGRLADYDFPGNVRELKNLLFRLAALVVDDEMRPEHIIPYLVEATKAGDNRIRDLRLEAVIREHILEILKITGDNKTQASRILGLPLTTLVNKMKRLGIC